MENTIRNLIADYNLIGIRQALAANPALANEGIPFDQENTAKAHPLHRIADAVFAGKCSDEQSVQLAKVFLDYGAAINGGELKEKKDTPLVAAASLHADALAIYLIEKGAAINHGGCHGGTALHWAAWCGRDKVVEKLIDAGAEINKRCIDFSATPLFWAVHGLKNNDNPNLSQYLECVSLLIAAGADKTIPNAEGKTVFDLTEAGDAALRNLIK